jgi:hypothetical protein
MIVSRQIEVTLNGGLEKATEEEEGEHVPAKITPVAGYGRREPARFMRVRLEDVGAGVFPSSRMPVLRSSHALNAICSPRKEVSGNAGFPRR